MIGLFAQAISAYYALVCVCSTLCFLVGSIWLFIAFIEDISQELSMLDVDQKIDAKQTDKLQRFCHVIQLYSDVKQLSDGVISYDLRINNRICRPRFVFFFFRLISQFNSIYEFVVLSFFLWTLSTIGSSLLVIQSEAVEYKTSSNFPVFSINSRIF